MVQHHHGAPQNDQSDWNHPRVSSRLLICRSIQIEIIPGLAPVYWYVAQDSIERHISERELILGWFQSDCKLTYRYDYGWPSYSQLIIFTSSKNIFTGSRNKTLAKATHN